VSACQSVLAETGCRAMRNLVRSGGIVLVTVFVGCLVIVVHLYGFELKNGAGYLETNPLDGDILFVSSTVKGLEKPRLCILHLPGREVEVVTNGPGTVPFHAGPGPVWGVSADIVYFSGERRTQFQGLCRLDRTTGTVTRVLPDGIWRHPGAGHELVFVRDSGGVLVGHKAPGVRITAFEFCFGKASKTLYVVLGYEIDRGLPDWSVDPDSLGLPAWAEGRVRVMLEEGNSKWIDLVAVDSLGNVTVVREQEFGLYTILSVSHDERFLGYSDGEDVHIYDRDRKEILVPARGGGARLRSASFSPDGRLLAAVGWEDKSGGIYICEAPGFVEFELLCEMRSQRPFDLCWSPDGDWILVHVAKRGEIGPMRLVALEVSTCTLVDIPMPFLVDGERDPQYYVNPGGIDWTD